ncbi:DegV family protein [Lutispora thermophila]|uniref:EDD domain protein, DegV family n=1 Tax=Lutispora thermophila DSM 19022 TaxID=1122184 RepID=A0A1M6IBK0_9FIRM|nr:DegV family protein [Lutispora thermophila]SHJ31810.1 EDD domain protein, DegV family [Lutispora thermophila DSM 19022]
MDNTKNKIALITDSSCDLPAEILKEHSIFTLPLRVIYGDKEYRDGVDITPQEVYDRMPHEIPKTSMASPSDCTNLFQSLREQGIRNILSINISSGLSGTYDMIKMISKDFPDLNIVTIDSKSLSIGLGFMVNEAAKMIAEGLKIDEIKEKILSIREKIKLFYCIPVLEYLKKGGRINTVAATIGDIMDIKPIISVNEEGKYYSHAKVRGRKKSLDKLVEIVKEFSEENIVRLAVMHGNAEKEALKIKETLSKLPNVKDILFGQIGPALGVHTGPGLVGVCIYIQ